MFDDAQDICKEAFEAGMHVYPITTKWEPHNWYRKLGFVPYRSFAHAVTAFLETYSWGSNWVWNCIIMDVLFGLIIFVIISNLVKGWISALWKSSLPIAIIAPCQNGSVKFQMIDRYIEIKINMLSLFLVCLIQTQRHIPTFAIGESLETCSRVNR